MHIACPLLACYRVTLVLRRTIMADDSHVCSPSVLPSYRCDRHCSSPVSYTLGPKPPNIINEHGVFSFLSPTYLPTYDLMLYISLFSPLSHSASTISCGSSTLSTVSDKQARSVAAAIISRVFSLSSLTYLLITLCIHICINNIIYISLFSPLPPHSLSWQHLMRLLHVELPALQRATGDLLGWLCYPPVK